MLWKGRIRMPFSSKSMTGFSKRAVTDDIEEETD